MVVGIFSLLTACNIAALIVTCKPGAKLFHILCILFPMWITYGLDKPYKNPKFACSAGVFLKQYYLVSRLTFDVSRLTIHD